MTIVSIYIPVIIILAIIVAVLSMYLVLHRYIYLKRVTYRQKALERLNSLVLKLVSGFITVDEFKGHLNLRSDLPFLRNILVTNMTLMKGEVQDKLVEVYQMFGFLEKDYGNLQSKKWWLQAAAARDLSVLQIPESSSYLIPLLDHPRLDVRLMAAYALGRLGDIRAIRRLMQETAGTNKWITIRLIEIIENVKDEALPELRELLRNSEKPEMLALTAQILGHLQDGESGPILSELCRHPNNEVRLKAIKALGDIRYQPAVETLAGLLDEQTWEIKALACKSLGSIGDPKASDKLCEKLSDSHWWVRYNAAGALAQMKEVGIQKLKESAEHNPDRFAREMAREKIEELALLR